MIKRHHLRYHQTIPEIAGANIDPPVPTASSQPAPPAIVSPQAQDFNRSQGVNPADTAPSINSSHPPSLLMDNYIFDAFLSDFDFQPTPDADDTGNFSG